MSDIEKQLERTIDDLTSSLGEAGEGLLEILIEGIKEFFSFKLLPKDKKRNKLIIVGILVLITLLINMNVEMITIYCSSLVKTDNKLLSKLLYKENVTRVFSNIFILTYVLFLGGKKSKLKEEFEYNFTSIGFITREKIFKKQPDGKKVQVFKTPKLLTKVELAEDMELYIFSARGTTLEQWNKHKNNIEDFLGLRIVKIDKTKSNRAIRFIAVTSIKYDEIMEENRLVEEYDNYFEKIGLIGKGNRVRKFLGEELKEKNYPIFIKSETSKINGKEIKITTFNSIGTELEEWKNAKYKFENVFNCLVYEIKQLDNDKQLFAITTLDLKYNLKDVYEWKDQIIKSEDGVIVLGEGLIDKVTLDLNRTPHVLLGGVTNSGKSVLSNCLAWQLVKQGAYIVPIDFKGGVELDMFSVFNKVISEHNEVLKNLKMLKAEHEERLVLFKDNGVKNLIDYNNKMAGKDQLARIVLVIDEIAEMLDRTGSSKGDAAIIEAIEGELNTLARLSRSTGINIITGTQRPDANVLKGQIKNNLGARICGRMTDIEPSKMVLGSPDAVRIPDIKGRYLFSIGADPITFQAYWFKEEYVKRGEYRKGRLLTINEQSQSTSDKSEIKKEKKEKSYEDFEEVDDFEDINDENMDFENKKQGFENNTNDSENGDTEYEDEEDFEPVEEVIDVTEDDDEDEYYQEVL